jgi:hypothetical protein
MDNSVPTLDLPGLDERMASEDASLHTLIPFAVEECLTIGQAATIAGKSERTLRNWCVEHDIGRRIAGGAWAVSSIALAMLLDDNSDALAAYHHGARGQCELVATYYNRLGLGDLLKRREFGGGQEEPPQLPAKSAQGAALR